MTNLLLQIFIYLGATVIAVPIAKRLGLGSVLGYLIAGVIIGPVIGLVGDETATIQHFAEFGVVMMLFIVGLELEPKMLWSMRNRLMGLGGLQVGLTTLIAMGLLLFLKAKWQEALVIGFIFSLSSTAIVLQTFSEKRLIKTEGGRNAFSVLLFQDIAVIPMLALIPLLASPDLLAKAQTALTSNAVQHPELNLLVGLPGWAIGIVITATIAFVVIGGHFLSQPLFRFVASAGLREVFTAAALMVVIGISVLMGLVSLSPALGTFLAGVVLANSEFRHELESNIEPFKGLLLGLFFITVGAGINFTLLFNDFWVVICLTLALMALKSTVLLLLTFVFDIKGSARWLFSLSLAQAGEFGFVLLGFSMQKHVLSTQAYELLSLVVALSMFFTPILFIIFDKIILPRYQQATNQEQDADQIDERGPVIIAGVGRFGQIVNRLLVANGFNTVVLDHEAKQVQNLREIKIKSYFGDATRSDVLEAIGIEDARLLVIAIDNPDSTIELVKQVKKNHPHIKILARAFDRGHAYQLRTAGANYVIKETFLSALEMGAEALRSLDVHPFLVEQQRYAFIRLEKESSEQLYNAWLNGKSQQIHDRNYQHLFVELEKIIHKAMQEDRLDKHDVTDREWTPQTPGDLSDITKSTKK